jgi:Asp-tRNA(Asn)/Glu-tRNA(Gln) amidotransferase A subunit family amidase
VARVQRHYALGLLCLAALLPTLAFASPASARNATSLTIEQEHAALADGKLTSVQLTRAFLARIQKYEPSYNAFTAMDENALEDARASDARRGAKKSRSLLDGVPIVIKDSVDVAGLPTTGGWLSAQAGGINLVPSHDAPVVARLRRAGAIIIGKTNLPAFSGSGNSANTSWAGPTYSVLNRNWAPGGSSTGTAAAVAADFATAGIGEETGGSIQNPAAAESLVGIKPTFALVPNSGVQPLAGSTRDVIGPIAKTVPDAADMLNVLAGYTLKDPKTTAAIGNIPAGGYKSDLSPTALAGARLGLYGPGWRKEDPLSPGTAKLYAGAIGTIEAQGATPVPDPFRGSGFAAVADTSHGFDPRGLESLPYDMNNYLKNLGPTARVHSVKQLGKALGGDLFGPKGPMHTFIDLSPQAKWSAKHLTVAPDLSVFREAREKYLRILNRVMAENDLDALVFPQATHEIPKLYGGGEIDSTTVSEINIAGLPAVVVPAGKYPDGKPFSLEFIGRPWSEAQLIGYAYAYEQATHARIVRTDLATTPGPKPPKGK